MNKIVTICVLIFCNSLIAQHRFNTKIISTKFNTERKKATPKSTYNFNPVASDTLSAYTAADNGGLGTLTLDYVTPYDTGFIVGTNIYNINTSLQKFDITKSGTMSDILMGFGYASGAGTFTVSVRADSAGLPGHIIESTSVPVSEVDMINFHYLGDSISYMGWNCRANLSTPLSVTAGTSLWIGLTTDSLTSYVLGMASLTDSIYPAKPNYCYQIFNDTGLYTSYQTCGINLTLSMFPVIQYPVGQIRGNVFNDANGNNVKDTTETGLENVKVIAGSFVNYTDANGNYTIYTDSGSYIIQAPIQYATETPASINVFVPDSGLSAGNNFAVHYVPNVRDVAVEIIPGPFRPGFTGDYFVVITNNGTQTDSGTVTLTLDDSLQYNYSIPVADNVTGHVVTLTYPPLNQGDEAVLYINANIPATIGLNDTLTCIATITPIVNDSNITNNTDTILHITQGSYDPNIKSVLPAGDISPTFVANQDYLNYTIQFQNTGTDTAFNINVVDTMSSNVDITTLEVLNSSSKCQTKIHNNQIVVFAFDNILLPDSGTNEIQSHGFVSYRIKPKNNLNIGDQIINTAYIYFDFNAPVVTNTTINTVNYSTVSIISYSKNDAQTLNVYPNPFTNDVMLSFNETGNYNVKVVDVLGAVKLNTLVKNSKNYQLDLSALSTGCYFITAEGEKAIYRTKIIKR